MNCLLLTSPILNLLNYNFISFIPQENPKMKCFETLDIPFVFMGSRNLFFIFRLKNLVFTG